MTYLDFNCYGESLDSTPDFFHMKRQYEEDMLMNSVENLEENLNLFLPVNEKIGNFDATRIVENLDIDLIKEKKTNDRATKPT